MKHVHSVQFSSVAQSCPTLWNSLRPYESQHARPPCPSPTPGVHSNSCPLSQWCHPAISSSVVPFSSCPQSLPALGSFPMSQLFAWHVHYHMLNRWLVKFDAWSKAPKADALGHPRGKGGEAGGREGPGWGDTCIPVADSCWCMAKAIMVL